MQLSTLIDVHGTTRHMQTHTTRAMVEGCDAQLLYIASKQPLLSRRCDRHGGWQQDMLGLQTRCMPSINWRKQQCPQQAHVMFSSAMGLQYPAHPFPTPGV
jgi:hypothetical protein